jgi:hypothetical protein
LRADSARSRLGPDECVILVGPVGLGGRSIFSLISADSHRYLVVLGLHTEQGFAEHLDHLPGMREIRLRVDDLAPAGLINPNGEFMWRCAYSRSIPCKKVSIGH